MAWQATTLAASNSYRDLLQKITEMATSKHVSAVAVNAGGSGYVANDILTITHASAALDCTIEVLTVDGGGAILTAALRNMGAFASRLSSIDSIAAAGTGYAVNEILQVQGGTYTQRAKIKVTGVSGGTITSAAIFESGGAYTAASEPSDPVAVVSVGPSGAGGNDDATFNVSWTGLIGTTGIAATGGTGSSATFDLTLTDTGHTAVRDQHDYSFNSLTDEKEVVLEGTVVGGDQPFSGFRSYTGVDGIETRYGLLLCGMTGHTDGIAIENNPNFGPEETPNGTSGSYVPLLEEAQDAWLSIDARRILGVVKCVGDSTTSYISFYVGLGNPFGTATENPFPMFVAGSTAVYNEAPDAATNFITGITEVVYTGGYEGPFHFFRFSDLDWIVSGNTDGSSARQGHPLYPTGKPRNTLAGSDRNYITALGPWAFFSGIVMTNMGTATQKLYPAPNTGTDLTVLIPVVQMRTPDSTNGPDNDVHAELANVYWISATKDDGSSISAEDTFTVGSDRYRVFRNAHRTEAYSYFAIKEI